jgi:hypothetical protein
LSDFNNAEIPFNIKSTSSAVAMKRRFNRPLSSTNYRPLVANIPDVNNLYSMDEQIFEDNDDDDEHDGIETLANGEPNSRSTVMNNFLSNGSIGNNDLYQ